MIWKAGKILNVTLNKSSNLDLVISPDFQNFTGKMLFKVVGSFFSGFLIVFTGLSLSNCQHNRAKYPAAAAFEN